MPFIALLLYCMTTLFICSSITSGFSCLSVSWTNKFVQTATCQRDLVLLLLCSLNQILQSLHLCCVACSWQQCSMCRWSTTQVQYQPVQKVQQKKVAKKFAKESSSIASRVSFHFTIHVEPIYTCECSMLPGNLTCHIDLLTTDVFYLCKFCRLLKTCWEQQYSLHL